MYIKESIVQLPCQNFKSLSICFESKYFDEISDALKGI